MRRALKKRVLVQIYNNYPGKIIAQSALNELKSFLAKIIKREKFKGQILSVVLVDNRYIRKLNRRFLGRNRATDVLAFPLTPELLGEIYISYDKVKTQARTFHIKEEEELRHLALHGLLHLLDYNHRTMSNKISYYLKKDGFR